MSIGFQIAAARFFRVRRHLRCCWCKSGCFWRKRDRRDERRHVGIGCIDGVVALVGFALTLWIRSNAKKPVSVAPQAQESAWAGEAQGTAAITAGVATAANALAQIMKTDVYTLPEDSTVLDAMKLFIERGISGVPVVDDQLQVVGFISDGDVMACLADQVPAFKSAWSFIVERENEDFDRTLKETMNMNISELSRKKVISVNVDDDLGEVTRVLSENHLKKAPVLDGDKMVGIINRSNITKYADRPISRSKSLIFI